MEAHEILSTAAYSVKYSVKNKGKRNTNINKKYAPPQDSVNVYERNFYSHVLAVPVRHETHMPYYTRFFRAK